jgi:hypothetical protein
MNTHVPSLSSPHPRLSPSHTTYAQQVNYNCHQHSWAPPKNESIARAVRQVAHVAARGFTGGFWYIGNEDGAPQHAALIAEHALAMKAVDPTMKVCEV